MTSANYSQIRQELEQMRAVPQTQPERKSPLYDFGLFILMAFFSLVLVVTVMLALGIPLQTYTVFIALPLAWLGLFRLRKSAVYALMIAVLGVAFLAICSALVSQFFDVGRDSNCYYKVYTGLLANGWNPFRQTLMSFANSTSFLPYNSEWTNCMVDAQPKGPFFIGAAFYALTGGIAYGKVFNLAGMAAAVCIVAPMIKDAFKINSYAAFFAALLACVNPVTMAQALSYYNDSFLFLLLTIAAASFAYMAYKPEGRYAGAAKAAAFLAVCLAVNTKTTAVLFCAILCLTFYIARVIAIAQSEEEKEIRKRRQWHLFLYIAVMIFTATCVLGAATYPLNLARYGDSFYGIYGGEPGKTYLDYLMSPEIKSLPLFLQFLLSLLSPTSNALFTDIDLKIPFLFSQSELALPTLDATTGGWGLVFSGILLVSLIVIFRAIYLTTRLRSRKAKFLVMLLFIVFVPVFFIPYLFSARYYLQLFWLPAAALIFLFAGAEEQPRIPMRAARQPGKKLARLLGAALCLLLAFNCVTGYNYLSMQVRTTTVTSQAIETIKAQTENGDYVVDISPMSHGMFYGALFNLHDAGLTEYNFVEHLPESKINGTLVYYMAYHLRPGDGERYSPATSFLTSLDCNHYLIVIAKQGTPGPLADRMRTLLNELYLTPGRYDSETGGYLAVIDPNAHVRTEESGEGAVSAQVAADELDVLARSAAEGASILIDGAEYALGRDGYNIVVYDTVNKTLVDSVVINTDASPVLSR